MQKIILYRHEIIWTLFLVTLPFSKAFINIALVLGLVVFFYVFFKVKRLSLKPSMPFLILLLVIIYMAINALSKAPYIENQSFFKLYPILIGSYFALYFTPTIKINRIKKIAIGVGLIYVVTCFIRLGLYYLEFNNNPFGNTAVINKLLILDRPYAGCFVFLNLLLVFDQITSVTRRNCTWAYAATGVFFLSFIVLIAARLALLSMLILLAIYLIFYIKSKLLIKIVFILAIPLIGSVLIYSSPGLQQRLFIGESLEVFKDNEPRFVIWEGVKEIVESRNFDIITGTGNYAKNEVLLASHYQKIQKLDKRNYYLAERFNTHNQFLDVFIFGGMLALIPILTVFARFVIMFRKNYTSFALLLGIILFMFVENIFHRQMGCYLFMLYLIIALKLSEQKNLSARLGK